MWQEKPDNIILPGQVPHGGNKILPPPPGNYDLGGSSRKRKSTAMDSPGTTSEYHFPWESNSRDSSSHLGLSGHGNNSGAFMNQANSAEPANLFGRNKHGVYLNQASFGHQFDNGHPHYSNNSSTTWPTRNTDFSGTAIATMTNGSFSSPPQSNQPFTVPSQQSQAGYVFGQTESHKSLPFPTNSDTEKAQIGPNLHDLMNFRNKNHAMCNTSLDFSRPVEVSQQNIVHPNRFSDGLNESTCSKDNKFETSCASTQSGHSLNNAGIVNLPSNRLLENEVKFVSNTKIKETTVASDTENRKSSLTEDISSKHGGSDDNIVAGGQRIDQSDGILKLDEGSKSPCGKTLSTVAAEKLWDGSLQLNSSVTVSAVAFFKSGEKLLDTNWSEFVEVKGKVRLEAFEKYIQDLPRSRNRGLMVISLYWKEGSSDSGLSGMKEVSKGYRKGGRVGFAHLSPGVDIYICPRSDTIITILAKYGFFKGMAAIEDNRDSMIGCVVWKKNRTSSNSAVKKGDSKNKVVSEPPLNSPSGSSTQKISEKQMSPTKPAQQANQTIEIEGKKVTEKKNNESCEAQNEVVKSSVDAITLNTEVYSPIHGSLGGCLDAEKPNACLERQSSVVEVVILSDDDDLPEYDFGIVRGVSVVPMSRPLDVSVPPTKPVVQAMPASSQRLDASSRRSDTSSLAANRSAPNQGMPISHNLEEHNQHRKATQTNTFESPKNSIGESHKKNLFDDEDDDDDMPEWCPPELHKQPLAESIRPSTSLTSVGPTFQNMSPGPPRAPLPSHSQAAPIRPPSALPSALLNSSLQNMSPRPLLPSPPSANASRAPFSYQTFRPTFPHPTITSVKSPPSIPPQSGPTVTSVKSPPSIPPQSGPRSSISFNSNSVPRPQYDDRRGWRP